MNVETGRQNIIICFRNNVATQIHFWENIKSEPDIYIEILPALHMQYRNYYTVPTV